MRPSENRRNIIILVTVSIMFSMVYLLFILSQSEYVGDIAFIRITNRTGKESSILASLVGYIFVWWVAGMFPAALNFLFMQTVWYILHIKDKNKFYYKVHEDYHIGGYASFISSYTVSAILELLHILGFIKIDI